MGMFDYQGTTCAPVKPANKKREVSRKRCSVCVCVRERERDRVCVCVCVCV